MHIKFYSKYSSNQINYSFFLFRSTSLSVYKQSSLGPLEVVYCLPFCSVWNEYFASIDSSYIFEAHASLPCAGWLGPHTQRLQAHGHTNHWIKHFWTHSLAPLLFSLENLYPWNTLHNLIIYYIYWYFILWNVRAWIFVLFIDML